MCSSQVVKFGTHYKTVKKYSCCRKFPRLTAEKKTSDDISIDAEYWTKFTTQFGIKPASKRYAFSYKRIFAPHMDVDLVAKWGPAQYDPKQRLQNI